MPGDAQDELVLGVEQPVDVLRLAQPGEDADHAMAGFRIDRVPHLQELGAHIKQYIRDKLVEHKVYIEQFGDDLPEIRNWRWKA